MRHPGWKFARGLVAYRRLRCTNRRPALRSARALKNQTLGAPPPPPPPDEELDELELLDELLLELEEELLLDELELEEDDEELELLLDEELLELDEPVN